MKALADLNKRMVVSCIVFCFVAILIIFSTIPWISIVLVSCMAAIGAIGIWEYAQLAHSKDLRPSTICMILISVCTLFAYFLSLKQTELMQLPIMVLVFGVILFFVVHFKELFNAMLLVALELFGVCYLTIPLCFMLGILYIPTHEGRWWFFYLLLVTKITDIGAYFVGRLWGRHPLAPVLSPKKTVEGALAGFACATILSIILAGMGNHLSLLHALVLGMLIGIIAQIGDLAESLLKRDAFVKDSNKLPGLGGVLDMLDSLLLTTPIVYFYLKFV